MFFGLLLGFILALMRLRQSGPCAGWRVFISLFFVVHAHRTTVYDLLRPAAVWYRINPIPSAMIGLSLNTAAYAAERCAPPFLLLIKVSGKQLPVLYDAMADYASRDFATGGAGGVPPLSNSFISLVKDTSLAATFRCRSCSVRRS